MKIESEEVEIRGKWTQSDAGVVEDGECQRIHGLISRYLVEVSRDESGWDILYSDPSDGRFWELTYPESESPGGGPPRLRWLDEETARDKYDID